MFGWILFDNEEDGDLFGGTRAVLDDGKDATVQMESASMVKERVVGVQDETPCAYVTKFSTRKVLQKILVVRLLNN